jgi:polar amino acid transport system substrate-binding protein
MHIYMLVHTTEKTMQKTKALALAWLMAASALLTACAGGPPPPAPLADKLSEITARGRLIVASETAYPPQAELIPGAARAAGTRCAPTEYTANQLVGFDIEVAVEIARRLGVEACFVAPTWQQLVAGSWGDRWDISVGSMVITPERMEVLYFTQPYAAGAAVIIVHQDNRTFAQPSDLSGRRIGVCAGCAYESYLKGSLTIPGRKIDYVVKNAEVIGYDTDTSALQDLAAGDGLHLDAVMTDPNTARSAIQDGLPVKQLGDPVYYDYVSASIDKKSGNDPVSFVRRVTEIVQQMHGDGTLLKLTQQYYEQDTTTAAAQFDIDALHQFP